MKFGKVGISELDEVNFSLPAIPEDTLVRLGNKPKLQATVRFGGTGWATDEWKGIIYPSKCPKNSYLDHYAKSFDTIELNSTHYTIPKAETVQKWVSQVGDDFRFCPKVLQYISHSKDLGLNTDRIVKFADAISHFENKLGPSFIQLPPYFDFKRLPILESFLKQWPKCFPLAVEVRHESYFQTKETFDKFLDLLLRFNAHPVITDVAGARYLCHLHLTGPTLFVRFVGNDFHKSDILRFENWAKIIAQLVNNGLEDTYFFPHQPDNVKPPHSAEQIYKFIEKQDSSISFRKIKWTQDDKPLLLFD